MIWQTRLAALVLVSSAHCCFGAVTLDFNAPIGGTITDANGLGTGFTHRLPGTGGSLGTNDPNLNLLTMPGTLLLGSTHADINGGANLGVLEAPGVFLPAINGTDFRASAIFRNVQVPNGSDQLMLYAGTSATNVIRAGFHELNVYLVIETNSGTGNLDHQLFLSPLNSFSPGDDVVLDFGRTNGLWQLSWTNLTNPTVGGSTSGIAAPWLNVETDLYVGVLHSNAGSQIQQTAQLDEFAVTVAPEPSSVVPWCVLGLTAAICRVQRRRSCDVRAVGPGETQ